MAHRAALAACLLAAASAQGACNLTGSWIDGGGDIAYMVQLGTSLTATSVSGNTGWTQANGAVTSATTITMTFGSAALNATISAGCTSLKWTNSQTWTSMGPQGGNVTDVHVVYMTHLDIGFTDFAVNVCDGYFQDRLPSSIALAAAMRDKKYTARFVHTTHPFLIAEFFDGASGCSTIPRTAEQLANMTDAIARGDIRWHGKVANLFPELIDGPGFDSSLAEAQRLNARFGVSYGASCAKSTDVPGLSRSTIPILAGRGLKAVHIGYNGACQIADIPQAFHWVHAETNTSVLVFANPNYGDVIVAPPHALAFMYQVDNTDAPSANQVQAFWQDTQARFPGATLRASSLDAFAEAVWPSRDSLPQVTSEIGDSWLYGSPAHYRKIAAFREARRLRQRAVDAGRLDPADPNLLAWERRILVGGPEHNFGLSFGGYVPGARSPDGNWSNALFHAAERVNPAYALFASSNTEKYNFTTQPLAPVAPNAQWADFIADVTARQAALPPTPPAFAGYTKVPAGGRYTCGRLDVTFNASDGSLQSLLDVTNDYEWVSPTAAEHFLGFSYKTFTEDDLNAFNVGYNYGGIAGDFNKQGMSSANPVHATWRPSVVAVYKRDDAALPCQFVTQLALDPVTVSTYGGMSAVYVNVTVDTGDLTFPDLAVEVTWFGKTATRLAEAAFLSFTPNLPAGDGSGWLMDVLGHPVKPNDVVVNGTRHIHGVWDGFAYGGAAATAGGRGAASPFFGVRPLDTPLVLPGDPEHLLNYDGATYPDWSGGWHSNLYNNLWGTAFPQWTSDDLRARYLVGLDGTGSRVSAALAAAGLAPSSHGSGWDGLRTLAAAGPWR